MEVPSRATVFSFPTTKGPCLVLPFDMSIDAMSHLNGQRIPLLTDMMVLFSKGVGKVGRSTPTQCAGMPSTYVAPARDERRFHL